MRKTTLATLVMITLAGCGSDNDNSSSSISGRVADGYLGGATICLDRNRNMVCDSDEPSSVSNSDGQYTLNISDEEASLYPIVAIVTPDVTDQDTSDYVTNAYTLVSPPGYYEFVSPITTILALSAKDTSAESLATSATVLRMQLGVSDDVDLYSDFIAAQQINENASSYATVHNIAQLVARKLGQHLATFNNDDSNGDIDKTELVVAMDSVIENVSELVELAERSDFDADVIALSKSEEWNSEVEGIALSDKYEQIVKANAHPKALSGGVYQYIDLNGVRTDYLTVKLNLTEAEYGDNYTLMASNSNGDIYRFDDSDKSTLNLDFPDQMAFVKTLPENTLPSDTYIFSIVDASDDSVVLFEDQYISPQEISFNTDLLNKGVTWVTTTNNEAFLSFPIEDDELYYQALLKDSDSNITYTGRIEQGRSIIWNDNLETMNSSQDLLVKVSDGSNHRDSNYVQELYQTGITEKTDAAYIEFARTYLRRGYDVPEASTEKNFVFQFNAEPAAEEDDSDLVAKVKSFAIDYFDVNEGNYQTIISATIPDNVFSGLGVKAEGVAEQSGYDLWHQLDKNGDVIYLDAFFEGPIRDAEMGIGTYRYEITDENDVTTYTYDYFGGEFEQFPALSESSFSVKTLDSDWYQLSIDTAEGDTGGFVYEFQFNVGYTVDGDKKHNYLFGLGRQREAIVLVSDEQLGRALDDFEEERGVVVEDVLIDISIFDSSKSYKIDNRYEITNIDFIAALEGGNN